MFEGFRQSLLLALLLAPGPLPGRAVPTPAPLADPVASLGERIRSLIEAPRFAAATWGIKVVSLDSGRVLFEHNAGKYFVPASNTKLFTAAMALQELGPQLRIRTSLYASAKPGADGALPGDLILYGRGDPTLMRPWNGGPYRPDPLETLAQQLQDQGVRTVQGDLVGDDSYFSGPPFGPGWEWEDLRFAYGAEPTALTLHHNVVDVWVYPAPSPGRPCFLFAQPGQGLASFSNATLTCAPGAEQPVRADRAPYETAVRVTGSLAPGADPAPVSRSRYRTLTAGATRLARNRRVVTVICVVTGVLIVVQAFSGYFYGFESASNYYRYEGHELAVEQHAASVPALDVAGLYLFVHPASWVLRQLETLHEHRLGPYG